VALLLVALGLRGGFLFASVGSGAGWVVEKVVHAVAYRDVAPEENAQSATVTSRVRVASKPGLVEAQEAGTAPIAAVPGEAGGARAMPALPATAAAEEPEPVELVTPLEQETGDERPDVVPYRSYGLRDPMVPLVIPGTGEQTPTRFSIHHLTLVGVAWQGGDQIALLEDPIRRSFLFREGEWLKDGSRVVDISESSITFAQMRYGETNRYTLRLEAREEEN